MPRSTSKRKNNGKKTRKQKPIVMIGCSKKGKKSRNNRKLFSTLGNKSCPNCGTNCSCGPNCKCPHNCPGNCYLNRSRNKKQGGGSGCGSCGCPIAPMSTRQMNMYGGKSNIEQPSHYGPILGIGQNGGKSKNRKQSGGSFYKLLGPIPGPFVGKAWAPDKLPGENGIGGDRNYLSPYKLNNDPQLQMGSSRDDSGYLTKNSMVGGYQYKNKKTEDTSSSFSSNKKKSSSSMRGGGFIPQDLVNLGRDFSFNINSAYNATNGYKAPVNPSPYEGQLTHSINNNRFII